MTLLLLDANGLFHQAFQPSEANPHFRSDGLPVGAVGGFLSWVHSILVDVGRPQCATHAIAVFDPTSRRNWRHDLFPSYKANRKPQPNARPQLRLCRALVSGLGISTTASPSYEADDVIAAYARQAEELGMGCVIATADKDALQLIRPGVSVYDFKTRNLVIAGDPIKLGVEPWQVPCFQGMVGDSSDNYPGIRGIGEKGAREALAAYDTMEDAIAAAATGSMANAKLARLLIEGADDGRLSRRLAVLDDQAPMRLAIHDAEIRSADPELIIGGMKALGVQNWTNSLATKLQVEPDDFSPNPAIIDLADELVELAAA